MRALKIIGAGVLAILGGRYLWQLSRTGKKAIVEVSGRIHKVTLGGVELVLRYNIKNPTKTSIEMAPPLVSLSYNGNVLASTSMSLVEIPEASRSEKGRIRILPFKETGHITTSILIPYLTVIGAGATLFKTLQANLAEESEAEPVKFEVATVSTVFTKVGSFPYDEVTTITL